MRQLIACLFLLSLCAMASTKDEPQWRVVMEKHIVNGSKTYATTIFTPKEKGDYRITASCSVIGGQANQSIWNFNFQWNDVIGTPAENAIQCIGGTYQTQQQLIFILTPQPNVPVTWQGQPYGPVSTFDLFFTVEHLQ
ncbi:MAG TPA: hypothetical protein VF753_16895 [Terriglobales bacterium]